MPGSRQETAGQGVPNEEGVTNDACFTCGEEPTGTCDLYFDTDEAIVDIRLCSDCVEGFEAVDWSEVAFSVER